MYKRRTILLILISIFVFLFPIGINFFYVFAATADWTDPSTWDICSNTESLKVFKFIGNLLQLAFIVVPILLIIMGSIDFMKATMAGKEDDIKKAQGMFVKRIISAIIVFFVPLIAKILINTVLGSASGVDTSPGSSNCLNCILNPSSC